MQILVRGLSGQCVTVEALPSDTIQTLITKIESKLGTNDIDQLYIQGKKLSDMKATIEDYKISEDDVIMLVLKVP